MENEHENRSDRQWWCGWILWRPAGTGGARRGVHRAWGAPAGHSHARTEDRAPQRRFHDRSGECDRRPCRYWAGRSGAAVCQDLRSARGARADAPAGWAADECVDTAERRRSAGHGGCATLARCSLGALLADDEGRRLLHIIMTEIRTVGEANGVRFDADPVVAG